MNKWLEIPSAQRAQILQQVAIARHLDATAIEKDWWVTMCLTALFQCRCADYINFKGGTSLSKCWHLIDRMSEDIDIAVDRKFFGLDGEITRRKDITAIRQALCSYVLDDLALEIADKLSGLGLVGFNVNTPLTTDSSTDPQIIEVEFDSVLPSPVGNRTAVLNALGDTLNVTAYNLLNLPKEYVASAGDVVKYAYSADGEKLYVQQTTSANVSTGTEYAANYRLEDGSLTMIHTDAGYYTPVTPPRVARASRIRTSGT